MTPAPASTTSWFDAYDAIFLESLNLLTIFGP